MDWVVPGTVLRLPREEADRLESRFSAMFLAGGMVLSQVTSITGLEGYTVQNWVKRGFLPPPARKKYSLDQVCRIISIQMLKRVLPMERICGLLSYVNGRLDDPSDDIIADSELYFLFVRLAARIQELSDPEQRTRRLDEVMADYQAPSPQAAQRVRAALEIMLTAWAAARLGEQAEEMLTRREQEYADKGENCHV